MKVRDYWKHEIMYLSEQQFLDFLDDNRYRTDRKLVGFRMTGETVIIVVDVFHRG